jgi:hypothetical protein
METTQELLNSTSYEVTPPIMCEDTVAHCDAVAVEEAVSRAIEVEAKASDEE